MTETGGKLGPAACIVRDRLAGDEAFHREMEVLQGLSAQLAFPLAPVPRPLENPKPRHAKKRGRA
jgi:hypothetical protein